MRCFRCGRKLKKAHFSGGKAYGPECAAKVSGNPPKTRSTLIAKDRNPNQLDMFAEAILNENKTEKLTA
jgi:hypothetical protein